MDGRSAFAANRFGPDPDIADGLGWLQESVVQQYEQLEGRTRIDTAEWVQHETERKVSTKGVICWLG